MYSFRQRADTVVVDEPLYGHYLRTTDAEHPGRREVLEAMDDDGERVVREVILGPCERRVHFFKNMAHHLPGLDPAFLDRITNVLLIRDPTEMLPSLARQLTLPHPAGHGPAGAGLSSSTRSSRATRNPSSSTPASYSSTRPAYCDGPAPGSAYPSRTRCSPGPPARNPRTAYGPNTGTTTSTPRPASRPTAPPRTSSRRTWSPC